MKTLALYRYFVMLVVAFRFFMDMCHPVVQWGHIGVVAAVGLWMLCSLDRIG